jgi:hypothetical protein
MPALIGRMVGEEERAAFSHTASYDARRVGEGGRGGLRDGLENRRPPPRGKAELPFTPGSNQLMTPRFLGELLVDCRDRSCRRLQTGIQRLGQCRQPVAEREGIPQRGRFVEVQVLSLNPADHGCGIGEAVRRKRSPPSGRIHEVQPDRIAQQSEFGIRVDG